MLRLICKSCSAFSPRLVVRPGSTMSISRLLSALLTRTLCSQFSLDLLSSTSKCLLKSRKKNSMKKNKRMNQCSKITYFEDFIEFWHFPLLIWRTRRSQREKQQGRLRTLMMLMRMLKKTRMSSDKIKLSAKEMLVRIKLPNRVFNNKLSKKIRVKIHPNKA